MTSELTRQAFISRQLVNGSGYEWLKDGEGKERLVARIPTGRSVKGERLPLDAGVFQRFSQLELSKPAIQLFANDYGQLFGRFSPGGGVKRSDGTYADGSTFRTWTGEIQDMRALVSLWRQIRDRDVAALQGMLHWTDRDISYVFRTPARKASTTIATRDSTESAFDRFDKGDPLLPARIALQLEVNKRLAEAPPIPRLAWTPDPGTNMPQRIVLVSPSLLCFMRLQLAEAIAEDRELHACVICGEPIQRGSGAKRANTETCSSRCRQEKYRRNLK